MLYPLIVRIGHIHAPCTVPGGILTADLAARDKRVLPVLFSFHKAIFFMVPQDAKSLIFCAF